MSDSHIPEWKLDRTIRVFVSSTFRDMEDERKYLAETVFPQIRKECKERSVYFIPVDLRWGITDEQSHTGKVAEICLKAIKRSRPFFIGLLGERYGWTPNEKYLDNNPGIMNVFPDIGSYFQLGLSMTEIEMRCGALGESMGSIEPKNAAFWLRSKSMPTQDEFREVPETDAYEKLEQLKAKIRSQKTYPVSEYVSVEDLGKQIHNSVIQWVDELFPGNDLTEFQKLQLQQSFFARCRTRSYVGLECDTDFDYLNTFVDGTSQKLVITGPPGIGKSALVAKWMCKRSDLSFAYCFVGASERSEYPEEVLRFLTDQLIPKDNNLAQTEKKSTLPVILGTFALASSALLPFGGILGALLLAKQVIAQVNPKSDPVEPKDNNLTQMENKLTSPVILGTFALASSALLPFGEILGAFLLAKQVIVQVNPEWGTIQPKDKKSSSKRNKSERLDIHRNTFCVAIESWLSKNPGKKLVILIDGINQVFEAADYDEQLKWLPKSSSNRVKMICTTRLSDKTMKAFKKHQFVKRCVNPLTDVQRKGIIEVFLEERERKLTVAQIERIANDEKMENPIILRTLLDELCVIGAHETLDDQIDWYLSASTQKDFFVRVLERLEGTLGRESVSAFLTALAASRRGLSDEELMAVVPDYGLFHWQEITFALDDHFTVSAGRNTFAHSLIREAAQERYNENLASARRTIIEQMPKPATQTTSTHYYDEVLYQYNMLNDLPGLNKVLLNFDVLLAENYIGTDFTKYWRRLIGKGYKLEPYFELDVTSKSLDDQAEGYLKLADFALQVDHFPVAEKGYLEVLKIFSELGTEKQGTYLPCVAMTRYCLGNLYRVMNRYTEAETEYKKALKIYRYLGEKNSDVYLPSVAMIRYCLGNLYRVMNRYTEAETEFRGVVSLYEQLCARVPGQYEGMLEQAKSNLADVICPR